MYYCLNLSNESCIVQSCQIKRYKSMITDSEISHENLTKRSGSEHHSKRPSSSLSLQSSSSKLFNRINFNNVSKKKCLKQIVLRPIMTGSTSCGRSSTVSTSSVNDNHTIQQENLDDGKVM